MRLTSAKDWNFAAFFVFVFFAGIANAPNVYAQGSEIKYLVNNEPITSYDIARRAAFLKLQRRRGANREVAAQEMIDQVLRNQEAKRMGIRVSNQQVDAAYQRFASSNKMTNKQLDTILSRSNVTSKHFKSFIRSQMMWGQVVQRQGRPTGPQSPTVTMRDKLFGKDTGEFVLQQIIFIVPQSQRKQLLARRRQEAKNMQRQFNGCQNTRNIASGLIDVTVRELGRVPAAQLPPEWEKSIKTTPEGKATAVQDTDKGVEFIGVCRARTASGGNTQAGSIENIDSSTSQSDKELLEKLKQSAQIVKR